MAKKLNKYSKKTQQILLKNSYKSAKKLNKHVKKTQQTRQLTDI